jgi:Kef-type K+ transport system membrane component KefB
MRPVRVAELAAGMVTLNMASVVAVFAAMALAAGLPALFPRLLIPGVVLEIAAGVVVGPQGFDLVEAGPIVTALSTLGMCVLFLLAGFEVDPDVLKGRPLRLAWRGWAASAVLAAAMAFALAAAGVIEAPLFTALALTTTAVGALLPILRDAGRLGAPYGPVILATGAVGEAAPLIALSLILAGAAGAAGQALILVGFAVGAAAAVMVAARTTHGHLAAVVARTMGSSGQFPLRLVLLLMVLLIALSEELRIDLVLGAFVAGAVVRAALPHHQHAALLTRLDGLGYGFLIPIFFVASGMRLDVVALVTDLRAMAMVPVFALLMLAVRGLPVLLLARGELDLPRRQALALHAGTQLPLVVAIATIAVQAHLMPSWQAASLVGGGVVTMLVYPTLGLHRLRR